MLRQTFKSSISLRVVRRPVARFGVRCVSSVHPSITPRSFGHEKKIHSGEPNLAQISPLAVGKLDTMIRPEVQAKCVARARIPTPHGPAFLHLYHNNHDSKEHLAIVIDPAQLSDAPMSAPPIRSVSLDAAWVDGESAMDRLIRGAYTGRLSEDVQMPSASTAALVASDASIPPPLVRIHSECYTGETIGSMRCDCGEQLDEAMRMIAEPITYTAEDGTEKTIPGRGVVIYMRQEGRGIGLASKLRAYNLQDLGHDTVAANLLLGHGADERGYEVSAAILRDLGLAEDLLNASTRKDLAEDCKCPSCSIRLLTNNPDKVQSITALGVTVAERVAMVPRSWQHDQPQHQHPIADASRPLGATLIGGGAVYGEDLDKYIKTKVTKMGHMLELPDSV